MPRPKRIAIVGGTHGNERGGILLVGEMRRDPASWSFPGLEIQTFLGNPEAIALNRRYVERDLNRCFGPNFKDASPESEVLELRRAFELEKLLRPDGQAFDLLIDFHNTTGAMDASWILTNPNPWPWYLGWKAWEAAPSDVRLYHTPETWESNVFVPSLGIDEITLEVGPAMHGTSPHRAYELVRTQLRGILERLSVLPEDFDPVPELRQADFPIFVEGESVAFPCDESGRPTALLHKDMLGRDYQEVTSGNPLFHDLATGTDLRHEGDSFWPVFVAEQAYVEKGIAFVKTTRSSWSGGKDILP